VCVVAVAGVALADAIPSRPVHCARGSHVVSTHAGPWCEPNATCDGELGALGGLAQTCDAPGRGPLTSCERIGLCVRTRADAHPPEATEHFEAIGACGAHDRCPTGATCNWTDRCVAPSRRAPPHGGHLGS